MKKINIIGIIVIYIALLSCDKMDDNYKKYIEKEKVYSPKVTNLTAVVGLKTATLNWENPKGDIAKKILITYNSDSLKTENMVNTAVLSNLEIKGYKISVFTIDAFNNYSIPTSIQIFPNGEK